jgi:hypothetical protein
MPPMPWPDYLCPANGIQSEGGVIVDEHGRGLEPLRRAERHLLVVREHARLRRQRQVVRARVRLRALTVGVNAELDSSLLLNSVSSEAVRH